jgi:hypothetical protein
VADQYPARSSETAWRVYDGEAVILLAADSTLNTLNPVATLIWEAADGQTAFSAVVARICQQFDVEAARADREARAFVDRLRARSLLTVGAAPQARAVAAASPRQARDDGHRRYEPPQILSQEVFETTALACGKRPGMGAACAMMMMKNS